MDPQHLDDLVTQGASQQILDRVQLLGSYLPTASAVQGDNVILDPYFSNREGFLSVYEQIDTAVLRWLESYLESVGF